MTNSEYEEQKMADLIEIMSDSESYGGPESNPEDQEEDPDEEGGPGERTDDHHLKTWVGWIESEKGAEETIKKHQDKQK